jgi:hypothetical protein
MDLKSVARDLEEEAMPFLQHSFDESGPVIVVPSAKPPLPLLTPPVATPTGAGETEGMFVADDTNTSNDAEAPAIEDAPVAQKKQRRPRAKKTVVATAAETAPGGGIDGRKKRGREAGESEGPVAFNRAPKLTPKADQTADEVAPSAGDEMEDFLQLEAENQKLRKLLAEKLYAENADLRKKLRLD